MDSCVFINVPVYVPACIRDRMCLCDSNGKTVSIHVCQCHCICMCERDVVCMCCVCLSELAGGRCVIVCFHLGADDSLGGSLNVGR